MLIKLVLSMKLMSPSSYNTLTFTRQALNQITDYLMCLIFKDSFTYIFLRSGTAGVYTDIQCLYLL